MITQKFCRCTKYSNKSLYKIYVTVLAFCSLVTKAMAYLMKWSVRTKSFLMLGGLLSSMVILMLVKST